jgi:hypothetical protein
MIIKKSITVIAVIVGAVTLLAITPWAARQVAAFIGIVNPLTATVSQLSADLAVSRAQNANYEIAYTKLGDSLSVAHTLNSSLTSSRDKYITDLKKVYGDNARLDHVIDSLRGRITGLEHGSGVVAITDTIDAVAGNFTDPWIDGSIEPDVYRGGAALGAYKVTYDITFKVGDVRVTSVDSVGNESTIYSVWLESIKTGDRRYLSDYVVDAYHQKDRHKSLLLDLRPMLSAMANPNMLGLGVGVFAYRPGSRGGEGDYMLRAPVITATSDFKTHHDITAGVSFNMGYYLPVVNNVYVTAGYGITQRVVLWGLCVAI